MLGALAQGEARMPWLLACTSSSSSMRSASSTSGMSLPLAAMLGRQLQRMPCEGEASTRSMAWLATPGPARPHLRAPRAYRDAAVAQGADDGFGILAAVIDDQQADGDVVRVLHALLPNLRI